MLDVLLDLKDDEQSVAATEYGLLAALVGLACISALSGLGESLSALFSPVEEEVARCTQVGSNCGK